MGKYFDKLYIIICFFISYNAFSQPVLTGLQYNPVIKTYLKSNPLNLTKAKNASDTINLPFFDDFAKPGIYPDTNLWLDNYAYINDSYGDNPTTLGVATLDIIDASGEVYTDANSASFIADYLTSKPINLNYLPADSVYLSFFYQPQGKAYNGPESKDSLVLEIKSPSTAWQSVWRAAGSVNQQFKQVLIPIKDTTYLKKGFQFRFKNYASIASSSSGLGSWTSNGDIWNIDYIKIDTTRNINDTIIDDVGCVYGSKSFLKNYGSIPWEHYQSVSSEQVDTFSLIYRNNSTQTRNIQRFVNLYNVNNNTLDNTFNLGSENAYPYQLIDYSQTFSYNLFPYNASVDSSLFLLKSYIVWDTVLIHKPYRWNDTIRYYQKFYNYYAYDDGNPESGYCLNGQGTQNAKLAYKCYTYKPDTLRAIQMYFNQTVNESQYSQNYFYLTIWSYKDGLPDTVVYQQMGVRPEYNGLNQFHNYLLDTSLVVSDTFFIGWMQTTSDCLNIGFDFSRNTREKTYFNIHGNWERESSGFEGSLMIRPVFGKVFSTGIENNKLTNQQIKVYPNPANDILNIVLNENKESKLYIYNLEGQLYKFEILIGNENKINIESLPKGMYIIKIITPDEAFLNKLIKL